MPYTHYFDVDLSDYEEVVSDVERCGVILVNNKGYVRIVGVPNRHKDSQINFQIDNNDVNTVLEMTREKLIGIFHTHPDPDIEMAVPSLNDINNIPEGICGMVYHPFSKIIHWYDSTGILGKTTRT